MGMKHGIWKKCNLNFEEGDYFNQWKYCFICIPHLLANARVFRGKYIKFHLMMGKTKMLMMIFSPQQSFLLFIRCLFRYCSLKKNFTGYLATLNNV